MNARLTLEPEALVYQGQAITTEGPDVEVAGLRLHIRQGEIRTAGTAVSLSGEFPLEESGAPGELRLAANADLKELSKFVPEWPEEQQIEGRIALNGRARNPAKMGTRSPDFATGGRFEAEDLNP